MTGYGESSAPVCAACGSDASGGAVTWGHRLCRPCFFAWAEVAPVHGALVAVGVPDTAEARKAFHVEKLKAWMNGRKRGAA